MSAYNKYPIPEHLTDPVCYWCDRPIKPVMFRESWRWVHYTGIYDCSPIAHQGKEATPERSQRKLT